MSWVDWVQLIVTIVVVASYVFLVYAANKNVRAHEDLMLEMIAYLRRAGIEVPMVFLRVEHAINSRRQKKAGKK